VNSVIVGRTWSKFRGQALVVDNLDPIFRSHNIGIPSPRSSDITTTDNGKYVWCLTRTESEDGFILIKFECYRPKTQGHSCFSRCLYTTRGKQSPNFNCSAPSNFEISCDCPTASTISCGFPNIASSELLSPSDSSVRWECGIGPRWKG
jgi:hypothetical protein